MPDQINDDEINVEGFAAETAATFPFEDPTACREILDLLRVIVEAALKNREARHRLGPAG